jgi:hypothetical protein
MSARVSTYTTLHTYPYLNAGILLHGYSAAVDWVKQEIAELAASGTALDTDSLSFDSLVSLKARGYITERDAAEEKRYVGELLRVLATKQAQPVDLIISKRIRAGEVSAAAGEGGAPPADNDRIIEGLQAILKAVVPEIKVRRLVRVTLDLSEPGMSQDDFNSLVYVIDHLSGDPKIAFEFYLRARDIYAERLADFRDRFSQARAAEILADAQSVSKEGYYDHLTKWLSDTFLHRKAHGKAHLSTGLRWVFEASNEAELAGVREIAAGLESLSITPLVLCRGEEMPPESGGGMLLVRDDEYALLSSVGKFFSALSILSFTPFFSRRAAVISVGLDGRCSLSNLPHWPDSDGSVSLDDAVELLKREGRTPPAALSSPAAEDSFCLQCPYCLICGGNPFIPEQEMASYDCSKLFHQKIGAILPALSRRKHEGK